MIKQKDLKDFLPDRKETYFKKISDSQICDNEINEKDIIQCIKTVMDPEIPVNIYDLGLIYSIKIDKNNVVIEMTLTNPNCPVAGEMPANVGESIESLKDLNSIEVKLVWYPVWTKDLMSEDAKLALDIF